MPVIPMTLCPILLLCGRSKLRDYRQMKDHPYGHSKVDSSHWYHDDKHGVKGSPATTMNPGLPEDPFLPAELPVISIKSDELSSRKVESMVREQALLLNAASSGSRGITQQRLIMTFKE